MCLGFDSYIECSCKDIQIILTDLHACRTLMKGRAVGAVLCPVTNTLFTSYTAFVTGGQDYREAISIHRLLHLHQSIYKELTYPSFYHHSSPRSCVGDGKGDGKGVSHALGKLLDSKFV